MRTLELRGSGSGSERSEYTLQNSFELSRLPIPDEKKAKSFYATEEDKFQQFLFMKDAKKTRRCDAVAPIHDSECALRMIECRLTKEEDKEVISAFLHRPQFKAKKEHHRQMRGCAAHPSVLL